jgi:hypothetical protein
MIERELNDFFHEKASKKRKEKKRKSTTTTKNDPANTGSNSHTWRVNNANRNGGENEPHGAKIKKWKLFFRSKFHEATDQKIQRVGDGAY